MEHTIQKTESQSNIRTMFYQYEGGIDENPGEILLGMYTKINELMPLTLEQSTLTIKALSEEN